MSDDEKWKEEWKNVLAQAADPGAQPVRLDPLRLAFYHLAPPGYVATTMSAATGAAQSGARSYPPGLALYSEHALHYELGMLHGVRALWSHFEQQGYVPYPGRAAFALSEQLHNALVEAFLVHARNLTEFYWRERGKTLEGHAALAHYSDYLGGAQQAAQWRKSRISDAQETALGELWDLVSVHMAHPSRSRTNDQGTRQVSFDSTVSLFDEITTAFLKTKKVAEVVSRNKDWTRWGGPPAG